jgi:hypothetical protein
VLTEDYRIDYMSAGYVALSKFAEQWLISEAGLSELVDS